MKGHADRLEIEFIREVERQANGPNGTTEDLITLARLHIEPLHDEIRAIEILKSVLEREPANIWAKYWLAHCYVYRVMDRQALLAARRLLQEFIAYAPDQSGAAYLLLGSVGLDLGDLSEEQYVELLEKSVKFEPKWVLNRTCLAEAYSRLHKYDQGLAQIRSALANILHWQLVTKPFDVDVKGVGDGQRQQVMERIKALESKRAS